MLSSLDFRWSLYECQLIGAGQLKFFLMLLVRTARWKLFILFMFP